MQAFTALCCAFWSNYVGNNQGSLTQCITVNACSDSMWQLCLRFFLVQSTKYLMIVLFLLYVRPTRVRHFHLAQKQTPSTANSIIFKESLFLSLKTIRSFVSCGLGLRKWSAKRPTEARCRRRRRRCRCRGQIVIGLGFKFRGKLLNTSSSL